MAEAEEFIEERCRTLQGRADTLRQEASDVNSQIEVMFALGESESECGVCVSGVVA